MIFSLETSLAEISMIQLCSLCPSPCFFPAPNLWVPNLATFGFSLFCFALFSPLFWMTMRWQAHHPHLWLELLLFERSVASFLFLFLLGEMVRHRGWAYLRAHCFIPRTNSFTMSTGCGFFLLVFNFVGPLPSRLPQLSCVRLCRLCPCLVHMYSSWDSFATESPFFHQPSILFLIFNTLFSFHNTICFHHVGLQAECSPPVTGGPSVTWHVIPWSVPPFVLPASFFQCCRGVPFGTAPPFCIMKLPPPHRSFCAHYFFCFFPQYSLFLLLSVP